MSDVIRAVFAAIAATALMPGMTAAQSTDWKKVDAALGKRATVNGEVHRYGLPRSDLHVTQLSWR